MSDSHPERTSLRLAVPFRSHLSTVSYLGSVHLASMATACCSVKSSRSVCEEFPWPRGGRASNSRWALACALPTSSPAMLFHTSAPCFRSENRGTVDLAGDSNSLLE